MALRTALVAALALLSACSSPPGRQHGFSANVGLSALPNLGFTAGASQVFRRTPKREDSLEAQATFQPWDDEDIRNDGDPTAGDLTQLQLGVKDSWPLYGQRSWAARLGVVWFRAEGEPNIVKEPGNYVGAYAGFGFETHLSKNLTMGPDLAVLVVTLKDIGKVYVVPQIAWRITLSI